MDTPMILPGGEPSKRSALAFAWSLPNCVIFVKSITIGANEAFGAKSRFASGYCGSKVILNWKCGKSEGGGVVELSGESGNPLCGLNCKRSGLAASKGVPLGVPAGGMVSNAIPNVTGLVLSPLI
jgi:hypothetical protein